MARILIIDDDGRFRQAAAMMLASQGHQPVEADDAHSGGLQARSQPPDLILLDVQMPAGGAPMLLKSLEGQPELAEIPIIFISGMPESKLKQWFPETPRRRCHSKPINWKLMLQQIDELLAP